MVSRLHVSAGMSRVLLAGDNIASLAALRDLLETQGKFLLCGQVDSVADIISNADQLQPDLIILDFVDWDINRLHAVKEMRQELPRAQFFLLTERSSFDMERFAVSRGIDAVFAKDEGPGPLLSNARAVCGVGSDGDIATK